MQFIFLFVTLIYEIYYYFFKKRVKMKTLTVNTTITYKEHEIKVVITYKSVKNINFRIKGDELHVSSPLSVSVDYIRNACLNINKRFLDKLISDNDIGEDYIYLLGEKKKLRHILSNDIEGAITYKNKTDLDCKLRSLALEIISKRVHYYEILMNIKPPYKVHVKKMTTRYGSNSRKTHSLSFSLSLIHYPLSVIDAVVVHELAHHRQFNHSKAFYDEINKYYPEYKQELKKLKGGHK